jgi:hypothetical protein
MNGRMYDPVLARFLSPDPFVQMPDFSQNYNRYAYCLNNPLKYTDPSGEVFGIDDAVIFFIAFNAINQGMMSHIQGESFWKGAAIGAASSLIGYGAGSAVSGLIGISSGFLPGFASGFIGGFASGATNAWLNGVNFKDGLTQGLISGGIGGLMGGLTGIAEATHTQGSEWVYTKEELMGNKGQIMTEQEIEAFAYKELQVKEGKRISNITNKSSGKYKYNKEGFFTNTKTGNNKIGAYVTPPNWFTGKVSAHFSNYVTQNPLMLKGVMIHEFTHVYDYFRPEYKSLSSKQFLNSTENSAIDAERNYYKQFKPNSFIESLLENCNTYQLEFQTPSPLLWKSPYSNIKVIHL